MEERLRYLTTKKLSSREIAAQLSFDFNTIITPQSVRGKCDRMGISIAPLPVTDREVAYHSPTVHKPKKKPGEVVKFWTPEREARLKELLDDGMTYDQIGYQFGKNRGAIASKCYQKGWKTQLSNQDARKVNNSERIEYKHQRWETKAKQRAEERKAWRKQYKSRGIDTPEKMQPTPPDKFGALRNPDARRVSFMKLQPNWCKFPSGDPKEPNFVYCGADVPVGSSVPYCEICRKIVYVPSRPSTSTQKLHR